VNPGSFPQAAQAIVQGRVHELADPFDRAKVKDEFLPYVLDSFRTVCAGADLVLVEGAGAASEINLRSSDIANMGFAEIADVPVILAGDIERGGVIAGLVGAHVLMSDSERQRTKGYVVNKFHGDVNLFSDAIPSIKERTGLECLGIVPFFPEAGYLPKEDAASLNGGKIDGFAGESTERGIKIAVPMIPHIANFDDLDPLAAEPDVSVVMIEPGDALPGDADVVLLPGSKATMSDLAFIRDQGWDVDIKAHVRRGGWVIGICGGFQMLGRSVADPGGVEGQPGTAPGLGLLDLETTMTGDKTLETIQGVDAITGELISGYEMHMGSTEGPECARPWIVLDDGRQLGARSISGRIIGGYLHGVFASDGFRHGFLETISQTRGRGVAYDAMIERALDNLADHLENHIDLDRLLEISVPPAAF